MLLTKASASVEKSRRIRSVNPGNNTGSGFTDSRLSRFSHFIAKLVTRLEALGSANMRRTCLSKTDGAPGLVKPRDSARVNSSWSGPVFQRKKESRDAN